MAFWLSRHGQLGAIPPPPYSERFPLESMRSGGAMPPPPKKRGIISAILAPYPMRKRQNAGKKKVHTTTVETLLFSFSGSEALWRIPSFRTYGVYPFPLFSQENGIHHSFFLLCDLRITRQTEKGGVPRWWSILFFPLKCVRYPPLRYYLKRVRDMGGYLALGR